MSDEPTISGHHGTCDICGERNIWVLHIDETLDLKEVKNSDFRMCKRCLKDLHTYEKRITERFKLALLSDEAVEALETALLDEVPNKYYWALKAAISAAEKKQKEG